MPLPSFILLVALVPFSVAETILGVYMFHRHGDRTAKSTPPTNLTDLGYRQVYESGQYYHDRYILADSPTQIHGISSSIYNQKQLSVSAPVDLVLQSSATGFLQSLYPPVGDVLGAQILRNGTTVVAPMNGYQLIPLSVVSTGASSENSLVAIRYSNEYYFSNPYEKLYHSTLDFYHSINPVVSGVFNESTTNFKNAYSIWDLINVAEIHNQTIPSADLITPQTFHQLFTLANTHEFNLAYNASTPIRAVAGMVLAGQIAQFLNHTIATNGTSNKLGIQFGTYGTFTSFFGLAGLLSVDPMFYGISNYACSMALELYNSRTMSSTDPFPAVEDLRVRFLWRNGTATASNPPKAYPLFGSATESLSWPSFVDEINRIALPDQESWCKACGNTTGICAPVTSTGSSSPFASSSTGGSNISKAVAGVIGAMVTLAVILGVEILIMLIFGLRLVSKRQRRGGQTAGVGETKPS